MPAHAVTIQGNISVKVISASEHNFGVIQRVLSQTIQDLRRTRFQLSELNHDVMTLDSIYLELSSNNTVIVHY